MTGGEKNRVPPEMEARETVPIGSEEKCQLPHPKVREEPFLSRARTRICTHTHTHTHTKARMREKRTTSFPKAGEKCHLPNPQMKEKGIIAPSNTHTHTPYDENPLLSAGRESHPPTHTLS